MSGSVANELSAFSCARKPRRAVARSRFPARTSRSGVARRPWFLVVYTFLVHHRPPTAGVREKPQGTVLIAMHMHFGFDVMTSVPVTGNLQRKAFEMHAIVFADGAFELLAQNVVQTSTQEWHKRRAFFQRWLSEFGIERRTVPCNSGMRYVPIAHH